MISANQAVELVRQALIADKRTGAELSRLSGVSQSDISFMRTGLRKGNSIYMMEKLVPVLFVGYAFGFHKVNNDDDSQHSNG